MRIKPVRFAVVGLGDIAQVAILPAFRRCKNAELVALVSGDRPKLEYLARKYRVPATYSYEAYDECLRSGMIDAVYIALPNHLHKEYAVRAARAGIHVLCEKPMAVTSSECVAMIEACEEKRVKLMIAYRLHFEATNLRAIELANRRQKLGDLRLFQSLHSQATDFPNVRTLPVSKGGGPSYDLGVYDINAARYIFRDEPLSVYATAANNGSPAYKHIEETMSVTLRFPKERLATILYSFGAVYTDCYRVVGTQGDLSVEPAYAYKGKKLLRYAVLGKEHVQHFKPHDHFSAEIDYFSRCIREDKKPEPSGLEGLADVRIIEAIFESARTGRPVALKRVYKPAQPSLEQEIDRPAFREPKIFHAKAPTRKKAA